MEKRLSGIIRIVCGTAVRRYGHFLRLELYYISEDKKMVYWISLIPGAIAGFALTWITAAAIKKEQIKFGDYSINKARIYAGVMFIFSTFLFGPFGMYMYSHYIINEGADFSLSITILVLIGIVLTIPKYKEFWKSYLLMSFLFIFALGWFLPSFHLLCCIYYIKSPFK